jgi:hypothetical protein
MQVQEMTQEIRKGAGERNGGTPTRLYMILFPQHTEGKI